MRESYETAFQEDIRQRVAKRVGSDERARQAYELFSRDMDAQGAPPSLVREWFIRLVYRRCGA
ncbi:MAG: hypothetical protein HYU56_04745 [Candidatus Aenigmarchaeota archaeon]|nr:hypothetical protein [Candidatus Aenigmarchaeota archaeon]